MQKIYIMIVMVLLISNGGSLYAQEKRSSEDLEALYNQLQHEINKHGNEYPTGKYNPGGLKYAGPYIQALEIMAKDRTKANNAALEAQSQGNPFYHKKFMELAELAQSYGDGDLADADILFRLEDQRGVMVWETLCSKAEINGIPLYKRAKELKFDHNITRKQVQTLLKECLKQIEHGGNHLPSFLWPFSPGIAHPMADDRLSRVEIVRILAKIFDLNTEYNKATELMDMYLQDALCLMKKGHRWYIKLAEMYRLANAKKYIEGFYAILYGKVEIEAKGKRVPAAYAVVTVTIPLDGETITVETDSEGNYEMKDVLLHKDCSPFKITAEHAKDKIVDSFDGPLEEPDPSYRHEKNLTIRKGDLLCTISYDITWEDKSYDSDGSLHTREYGSISVMVTGIMRIQLEESTSDAWYDPENFKISYVYSTKYHQKTKDCPSLIWKLKGSGSAEPRYGNNYLRIMDWGGMGNYLEFVLPATKLQTVKGRKRISSSPPECKMYKNYSEEVVFGNVFIRFPVSKDGKMSGSRSWSSGDHIDTPFKFGINQFGNYSEYDPGENAPTKENSAHINASWQFEKLKK
jgi:hypothetical protein